MNPCHAYDLLSSIDILKKRPTVIAAPKRWTAADIQDQECHSCVHKTVSSEKRILGDSTEN